MKELFRTTLRRGSARSRAATDFRMALSQEPAPSRPHPPLSSGARFSPGARPPLAPGAPPAARHTSRRRRPARARGLSRTPRSRSRTHAPRPFPGSSPPPRAFPRGASRSRPRRRSRQQKKTPASSARPRSPSRRDGASPPTPPRILGTIAPFAIARARAPPPARRASRGRSLLRGGGERRTRANDRDRPNPFPDDPREGPASDRSPSPPTFTHPATTPRSPRRDQPNQSKPPPSSSYRFPAIAACTRRSSPRWTRW